MSSPERRITRRHILASSVAAIGAPLVFSSAEPARAARRRPASLELDPTSYVELDADFLKTQTAHYARIKRLRDGRFMLLYQTSQHSWNVYWSTSHNLKRWAEPQLLFASHKILDGADDRCYATADARVLDNGEVLAVCSFRANRRFSTHMKLFGTYRKTLLATRLRTIDSDAQRERQQEVAALQRSIADTDTKIKRAIRNLELVDDPDPDFVRDVHQRRAELRAHKLHLETKLTELERAAQDAPNPDLIDALPVVETITAAQHAAHSAITAQRQAETRERLVRAKDQANAQTTTDQGFLAGSLVVEASFGL